MAVLGGMAAPFGLRGLPLDFAAGAEFEKVTVVAVIIVALVVAAALITRCLGGQISIRG